ncbi:MAG: nucleoside hydrolase [Gammaproteobacteria bacterium]
MAKKIIIDTDPGIDDAQAILLAASHPALQLIGLTTVFGNVPVTLATANALRLTELIGQPIPVAVGAAEPVQQNPRAHPDFVHGADGFGNIDWPAAARQTDDRTGAQFIVDSVRADPGAVTLIAIGPLTNLALALELEPQLPDLVEQVIVMGGAVFRPGNVTPAAEANIICDPHAAEQVFSAPWPLTLVGLDVTMQLVLERAVLAQLRNSRYGGFLHASAQFYMDFYQAQYGVDGCFVHDSAAVMYAIEPALFSVEQGAVLALTEGVAVGQTLFAPAAVNDPPGPWNERPSHQVCLQVDRERHMALMLETLARA